MDRAMTEVADIERQKRRQAEFVNDEQQRLLEIEDMRLVVKFGEKKCYSDQECQAIYQELVEAGLDDEARRNPDAIEAVFKKLNVDDEAETARRDLGGCAANAPLNAYAVLPCSQWRGYNPPPAPPEPCWEARPPADPYAEAKAAGDMLGRTIALEAEAKLGSGVSGALARVLRSRLNS
jgi:hypothetical protein